MLHEHQQQLNVVTVDPQIVNEAWTAIAAARQDAHVTRLEAMQHVELVEAGAQSFVQSVEQRAEHIARDSEMRLTNA